MVTLRFVDRPRAMVQSALRAIILMTVFARSACHGADQMRLRATGPLLVLATERVIATALERWPSGVARSQCARRAVPRRFSLLMDCQRDALSREFGTHYLSLGAVAAAGDRARAVFASTTTILLDEATASIDPLEEQAVYQRFMKIAAGRIAIIVTHRLGAAGRPHPGAGTAAASSKTAPTSTCSPAAALYHRMFTPQAAWYRRS